MRYIIASILALASSVTAVGNAVVVNKTPSTFYLWSVGDSAGDVQTVAPGANYTEAFHTASNAGGIAIKMTLTKDGLYTSAPTQVFSYSLDGEQVWYDLSSVFGDAFSGKNVTVTASQGGTIDWPTGSNPGGSQVKVTSADDNVIFTAGA